MRQKHCLTWNMARKLKNVENETQTLFKINWWNTFKNKKMRNVHCKSWSMAKKMNIVENEKHTLQDLECGKKQ